MSSASVTHNFVNGTTSDADAVDQNFSDLVNIINSHLVHKGETALEAKTGSPGWKIQGGERSATPDANSLITVTFGVAFSTIPGIIQVTPSSPTSGGTVFGQAIVNDGAAIGTAPTTTTFQARCFTPGGVGITAGTLKFHWLAIGT